MTYRANRGVWKSPSATVPRNVWVWSLLVGRSWTSGLDLSVLDLLARHGWT